MLSYSFGLSDLPRFFLWSQVSIRISILQKLTTNYQKHVCIYLSACRLSGALSQWNKDMKMLMMVNTSSLNTLVAALAFYSSQRLPFWGLCA
jgi:hypothetical protein